MIEICYDQDTLEMRRAMIEICLTELRIFML